MEMEDRFATVTVTVATVLSEVDQLEESVTVSVVPLSYVPVATICCVLPTATDGVEGDTVTVVKVGPIKKFLQPAVISAPSASSPRKAAAPHSDRIVFRFIVTIPVATFVMN